MATSAATSRAPLTASHRTRSLRGKWKGVEFSSQGLRRSLDGVRMAYLLTRGFSGYPCDPFSPSWQGGPAEVRLQGNGSTCAAFADPAPSCRCGAWCVEVYGDSSLQHTLAILSLSPGRALARGGGIGVGADTCYVRRADTVRCAPRFFFTGVNSEHGKDSSPWTSVALHPYEHDTTLKICCPKHFGDTFPRS